MSDLNQVSVDVKNIKIIISVWLVLVPFIGAYARTADRDTLSVYFEKNHARIDMALDGNKEAVDSISRIISRYGQTPEFRISIKGMTSPEGASAFNQWLSHKRVESFVEYLKTSMGVSLAPSVLDTAGIGVDWDGLARCIEQSEPFRGSDEALSIIRDTPIWITEDGKVTGGRLKSLKDLRGGEVYRYLMNDIFPSLRRVSVALEYSPEPLPAIKTVSPMPVQSVLYTAPVLEPVVRTSSFPGPDPYYRLALKTNLLADIALMPSLEVEYLINEQWSVAAHGAVAWWSNEPAHKFYQISTIYPEARWWFKTKAPWHGHYLGLFAGGTWYDLERGARGYQGEGGFVGLSYGYMFPVSKCLSFEAGLGLGYLYTKYREYLPVSFMGGTHYVYQQTSVLNWIGPLKVKFAFVWRFLDSNKKGGAR